MFEALLILLAPSDVCLVCQCCVGVISQFLYMKIHKIFGDIERLAGSWFEHNYAWLLFISLIDI